MPFVTPPTFADADILTATQLNILSDDLEYLHGLVSGVNTPFNSLSTTVDLTTSNNQWLVRHTNQYLHYKMRVTSNENNDLYIYMVRGGHPVRLFHDNVQRSGTYTYEGFINLEDVTTWLIGTTPGSGTQDVYQGAWIAGTYNRYDIALNGGTYWYCSASSTTEEPTGTPADWVDFGTFVTLFGFGQRFQQYVETNVNTTFVFIVDYMLESDETSL